MEIILVFLGASIVGMIGGFLITKSYFETFVIPRVDKRINDVRIEMGIHREIVLPDARAQATKNPAAARKFLKNIGVR